ncbi:MAG: hypothetical protein ABIL14_02240 [candidate division WOR-3 bacterium]
MKRIFSVVFTALILLRAQNGGDGESLLNQAQQDYEKGEYTKVISTLEGELNQFKGDDRVVAHKYLGLSYLALGDNASAKDHFKLLLKMNPKFLFDTTIIKGPGIVKAINEARKEIAREAAFCSCFIPGSGQMIKGEDMKGRIIMLGSGISLAGALYLWTITNNKHEQYLSLGPDDQERMDEYYDVYNRWYHRALLGSTLFIGIYLYNFIDAMFANTEVRIASNCNNCRIYCTTDNEKIQFGCGIKFSR